MELPFFLSAIVLAFYGLIMVALISKYRQVKRARTWLSAPGKILSSRSQARKVTRSTTDSGRGSIADTEIRNFATVRYEFLVGSKRMTGERISIGEDLGNFQVAETLQRYPVGKTIMVFYDPAQPATCVIERDISGGRFDIVVIVATLTGVALVLAIFAFNGLFTWLASFNVVLGRLPEILFLVVLGLLASVFAIALYKRGAATCAWPKVTGTIMSSSVDEVKVNAGYNSAFSGRMNRMFRSRTIYRYRVNGMDFQSDRTSFGARIHASFRLFARHGAAAFSAGQPIDVYYDPAAPEQAVLTRGTPGQIVVWLAALAFFAIAAVIGRVI